MCFHGMRLWLLFDLERHNPLPLLYHLVQLMFHLKIEYLFSLFLISQNPNFLSPREYPIFFIIHILFQSAPELLLRNCLSNSFIIAPAQHKIDAKFIKFYSENFGNFFTSSLSQKNHQKLLVYFKYTGFLFWLFWSFLKFDQDY